MNKKIVMLLMMMSYSLSASNNQNGVFKIPYTTRTECYWNRQLGRIMTFNEYDDERKKNLEEINDSNEDSINDLIKELKQYDKFSVKAIHDINVNLNDQMKDDIKKSNLYRNIAYFGCAKEMTEEDYRLEFISQYNKRKLLEDGFDKNQETLPEENDLKKMVSSFLNSKKNLSLAHATLTSVVTTCAVATASYLSYEYYMDQRLRPLMQNVIDDNPELVEQAQADDYMNRDIGITALTDLGMIATDNKFDRKRIENMIDRILFPRKPISPQQVWSNFMNSPLSTQVFIEMMFLPFRK